MTYQITSHQHQQLEQLIKQAGDKILAVYQNPELTDTSHKADSSPLTAADLAAHQCLSHGLKTILDIPILSEESPVDDYKYRHQWQCFWLLDPLDGTKEFLARNGQFTVNVALIYQGLPLLGLVYQPTEALLYRACNAHADWQFHGFEGAWKQQKNSPTVAIHSGSLQQKFEQKQTLICLVSQHHSSPASDAYLQQLNEIWPGGIEKKALGSSLKICAVAEGSADLYLRLGPTSEWDTAAAQAVLEAAGGKLVRFNPQAKAFSYNQRDSLLNNDFCACADPEWIIQRLFVNKI
jgi:3'(2'), 5'-bisphosphate nucleotidase